MAKVKENEEIKQIREMMKEVVSEEIKPINKRLDNMQEQLDEIKENTEITREVLNEVVKWIDYNFRDDYPFPVKKQII